MAKGQIEENDLGARVSLLVIQDEYMGNIPSSLLKWRQWPSWTIGAEAYELAHQVGDTSKSKPI